MTVSRTNKSFVIKCILMKKKRYFHTVLLAALSFGAVSQNQTEAPQLISSVPAFGDCNVDAGLTEIVVKFDQEMINSVNVGNTLNLPQVTAKATWTDSKTLTIPVKLFPGKLYTLAFNRSRARMANTTGQLLNPVELHFRTKPDVDSVDAAARLLNGKAYEELIAFFPKRYSYATLRGVDWTGLLKQQEEVFRNAKTNEEFALKLVSLLRLAQDPHVSVEVNGLKFYPTSNRFVEYNYGYKELPNRIQNKKATDGMLALAGVIDSVGYLSIRSWVTNFMDLPFKNWGDSTGTSFKAEEVLKELFDYKNLIVDVRSNSGGNERFAIDFAAHFMTKWTPYEKVLKYNPKTEKFDLEHVKSVGPNTELRYTGNLYVLSGPSVFSSNESFILMMKEAPNATVIGMKTYGGSGNPLPFALSNGVKVNLPSWQAYALDGMLIEGNGVAPDLEVKTVKSDFSNRDVLVEAVLKNIKSGGLKN